MLKHSLLLFFLSFNGFFLLAQSELEAELKAHVVALAADEMEGRETGTQGEVKAANYIIAAFEEVGVSPKGEGGSFLQEFEVLAGKYLGRNNSLKIHKTSYQPNDAYYPLEYTGNGTVTAKIIDVGHGVVSLDVGLNDYAKAKDLKGKVFLMETSIPIVQNPHADAQQFADLRHKVSLAEEKGAAGIIFVNTSEEPAPFPDFTRKLQTAAIPVIFVKEGAKAKKMAGKTATISVDMIEDRRKANNVIGYIDNKAALTVIIGGHYDHLGYGGHGSRYTGKDKQIHNGADDNASGISVILELAETMKGEKFAAFNYLFIAFSGEEMGLLGSRHFVDNPTIDLAQVNYMLNLDMVGRLKNRSLIVNATGTSPDWGNLIVEASPRAWGLNITGDASGTGPSDHTSFYLKDLPVLALFSGTHKEYHTPDDDPELLNYTGMALVKDFIQNLVLASAKKGKLAFAKTKENTKTRQRRFSVTLGVMPNYAFEGPGMKIDGATAGKPAEKAGMIADDIILRMGDIVVKDIYDYMDALEHYNKGDKISVKINRAGESLEVEVTF